MRNRQMGGIIKLTNTHSTLTKSVDMSTLKIEDLNAVKSSIRHAESLADNGQTRGAFQLIADREKQLPGFVEDDDPSKPGIGYIENPVLFGHGHRRGEGELSDALPAFIALPDGVEEPDGFCTGIGNAEVPEFIET